MQIVSLGDNLHEMSNPFSGKIKKNLINLSSAESAHSMLSVKAPYKIAADNILNCSVFFCFFLFFVCLFVCCFFFRKIWLDISCESSA